MSSLLTNDASFDAPYISTGHLPSPDTVKALVAEAHARFKSNKDGENSQVYPALSRVPAQLFGICVVGTAGTVHAAGDTDHEFSIMSVSKPFLFALICEQIGADAVSRWVSIPQPCTVNCPSSLGIETECFRACVTDRSTSRF